MNWKSGGDSDTRSVAVNVTVICRCIVTARVLTPYLLALAVALLLRLPAAYAVGTPAETFVQQNIDIQQHGGYIEQLSAELEQRVRAQ